MKMISSAPTRAAPSSPPGRQREAQDPRRQQEETWWRAHGSREAAREGVGAAQGGGEGARGEGG